MRTKFNFNFPPSLNPSSYLLGQVVRRGDESPLLNTCGGGGGGAPLNGTVGASCSGGATHGGLERGGRVPVIHGRSCGRIT